jgi:tetratricopeptide (TPR) repeat protein/transglutaminase-like putative cysteine protease
MNSVLVACFLVLSALATALAQQAPRQNPASPAKNPTQSNPNSALPPSAGNEATPVGPAQAGTTQSATPATPDYSQEAYVVEHSSDIMRFENDGTGVTQTEAQIKIISESGVQALGQLKVGYSALSEKLDIAYVRVRKPDGTVVNAQESAVQDLTFPDAPVYTDFHEKHISVPSLRPGDVLEYRFVRTIASPLAPGQFWTSYDFTEKVIVLDEVLEINVPKDRQIKLKTKPGYDAKVTEDGDRRIYRWTHTHLKDDDDNKKKKKPKKEDDETPSVQLTTFKSWEELGAWYANLERERRIPDAAVKSEADALVKGKTDDMAKVKALYDYVSRNIRYVSLSFGLGRIQPHAASEVLANGYGDCKDKNTLLAALLDAEGFHSTSVLIGTKIKLDPDVPSPSQFDHVITRVPVDGKEIWLDSTPGVAPFRMLSATLRQKQALAIPPDGPAVLVWTPSELPFQAFDRTSVTGTISDTGALTAHVSTASRGDTEMVLRYAMRRMPSSHWKDIFDYMLQHAKMQGDITNLKASDPSATDDPLTVDFDVTVNNYFDWSAPESKIALPLGSIHLPNAEDDEDEASTSTEPIKLGAIRDDQADVKLSFPAKYSVHPPLDVDLKRDYAEYHSVYKFDAGQLTSHRTLKIAMPEIPASRSEDFAAFRRVVNADEAQQIRLENQSPGVGGAAAGSNESTDDLFNAGVQALQNQHYEAAVDLLQRVIKQDPKFKDAWNDLGNAYLHLGKNEEAIAAFKKQIENNAYDGFAYNSLGLAYEHQGRYDEAASQFQKQIEVNPLDQYAHGNLGRLYLDQKKYAEAVPELEKAVNIQPKNPLLLINLGQAYLGVNQTDKGMAEFEKAVAISAAPLIWNNIAYSLAEQNVQLDRATTYADSATNALETQLHDINLDNLRMQDLGTTQLMFSVWDTKGWIDFKRGDIDGAEKYIVAAWQAGGTGDEAEHLGEIYEKRGKHDQAIDYYLLALVAEDASPDARAKLMALGVTDIDKRMTGARVEYEHRPAVSLNKSDKGTAEFYLLVSPGKVEQVKFIKGDDTLKSLADVLQKTDVGMKFPPQTQARVVRRAVVHCGSTSPGPCTVELIPSAEVRALE